MLRPDEVLRENRRRAQRAAEEVGIARLRPMLERAQRELEARIARAEGLRGAGKDSFSAVQARVVLRQVEDVLRALTPGMRDLVVDQAVDVSGREVAGTLDYLRAAEQVYRGSVLPLALDAAALQDEVRAGAQASALRRILTDPNHRGRRGVLDRYGESVVGSFERALQQRVLQKKPWAEVRESLVAESPFLQQAPAHWAERIVRTEAMHASNYGAQETIAAADDDLGDVLKVLSATFDGRTSADSYAVHGQIRRAKEAFDDWFHSYEHPPNRPNDREVVVPHRASWPIPAALKPRSDAEVAAAWAREGRKGSPPPRPRLSTVDLAAKPRPRPPAPTYQGAPPAPVPAPPPAPTRPFPTPLPHGLEAPAPASPPMHLTSTSALASPALDQLRGAIDSAKSIAPSKGNPREVSGLRSATKGILATFDIETRALGSEGHRTHMVSAKTELGGADGLFHHLSGKIEVTKEVVDGASKALAFIADRSKYEAANRAKRDNSLWGLRVLLHEELHAASRVRTSAVRGIGVALEEATTEILARHLTRELAKDPEAFSLPKRGPSGKHSASSGVGSYNKWIAPLLDAVDHAYGAKHPDMHARVERALLATRSAKAGTSRDWKTPEDHVDAFARALGAEGLSAAGQDLLRAKLNDPKGPLS